jgi:hypothetical protein
VIRGWSNANPDASFYYEALAESLSLIVLKGDTFTRSLSSIYSPKPNAIEIRNIYRAAFEQAPLADIMPTVSFELITDDHGDGPRVDFSGPSKRLQEHLSRLYGDCSKIATPAFEVTRYLTQRGWYVYAYQYADDGCTVKLTNFVHTVVVRINEEPIRLDRAAIRKYQQTRKH